MNEQSIVFVGVHPGDKGGIASVLQLYRKHFTKSRFFASRVSGEKWAFPFTVLRFIWFLITVRNIRIVHLHGASRGSFFRKYTLFLVAKYLFRKKVVYHIHGAEFHQFYTAAPGKVKKLVKHFIQHADVVVCLSDSWKAFFLKHFRPKKIVMVHNTVEQVMPAKTAQPGDKMIFLFMGKIGERKGIYDLLKAAAQLQMQYPGQFEVWIGGDGAVHALQALIETNGLKNVVQYKGWVSGEAKEMLFRQAQVFVLPSYNEGMPMSVLEAMAWHLPVIATTVGGIPELVKDGHSGLLIKPGDQTALHHAMAKFVQEPALALRMGDAAAGCVAARFVFDITKQQLAAIYAALEQ